MNKEQVERLNVKLVATQTFLNESEERKKSLNSKLNEDIKGAKKQINAIVESINERTFEPLVSIFTPEEIKYFDIGIKG